MKKNNFLSCSQSIKKYFLTNTNVYYINRPQKKRRKLLFLYFLLFIAAFKRILTQLVVNLKTLEDCVFAFMCMIRFQFSKIILKLQHRTKLKLDQKSINQPRKALATTKEKFVYLSDFKLLDLCKNKLNHVQTFCLNRIKTMLLNVTISSFTTLYSLSLIK